MKLKSYLSFILATLLFTLQNSFAQTISLKVDAAGNPAILLNGQTLYNNNIVTLNFATSSETALKFSLNNTFKKPIAITIKAQNDVPPGYHSRLSIDSLQTVLQSVKTLTTDDKLLLTVNGMAKDLNTPFSLTIINTADNSKAFQVTFVPVFGGAPVPAGNPRTGSANGSTQGNAQIPQNSSTTSAKLPPVYKPGSAVYDALKLANPANVTETELKTIIGYYFPKSTIDSKETALAFADTTPFLSLAIKQEYINGLKNDHLGGAQSAQSVLSSLSMSSIGGLDVTTIADGLAKFLVKRAKNELSGAFFDKLKIVFDGEPDLKTLFPKTVALLEAIGEQGYDYQKYLQNLRESFKNDVDNLDANLPAIIPNHQQYFNDHPDLSAAIIGGSFLVTNLRQQVHPGDIIANYPISSLDNVALAWKGSVQTIQLLSASLRDTASTDSNYWVNIKYMRQLVNDKTAFEIYLGLVYREAMNDYSEVLFDNKQHLTDLLKTTSQTYAADISLYSAYKLYISNLAEKAETINKMIKSYRKPKNDSLAVELYNQYFAAAIDLVKYAAQITKLPKITNIIPNTDVINKDFTGYLGIIQDVSDLAVDINRKNYSSAINQLVTIYKATYTVTLKNKLDAAKAALIAGGNSPQTQSQLNSNSTQTQVDYANALHGYDLSNLILNNLTKYGGFLAAVATAKTSDDVEAALESFVLPPGSSSVKRESPFNVAFNGYVGLFCGHEQINGVAGNSFFNTYGLTAPVGVSVSWGQRKFFNPFSDGGHASYSLFISLIDIGAVAAYRFKNDTTSQVPTIQLKNIFSPGAFLSIGIPKTPLSVNFGAQSGPNLRTIDNNSSTPSADISNRLYWRYSVSLVVDIPLLDFYTKSADK